MAAQWSRLLGPPWLLLFLGAALTSSTTASFTSRFLSNNNNGRADGGLLAAGPRSEGSVRRPSPTLRRRRRDETVVDEFDGKALAAAQVPNEGAPHLDLKNSNLRCMSDENLHLEATSSTIVQHPCFEFKSLDDIHAGLSEIFNSDASFRNVMRLAIRQDIFDSTPSYAKLSAKAASILLLPDSSLQGSWRSSSSSTMTSSINSDPDKPNRMMRLSRVLLEAFGSNAPSGDELLHRIGALCGNQPSTHFIDIVGVQDRKLSHSWHLDTGLSPENSKTVLWGFPVDDDYNGCGVFSHLVPLRYECHAPASHPRMEPILFQGTIDEQFIIRPSYAAGRELLIYRDIDVLHSSPDVAYRTSVMRFM